MKHSEIISVKSSRKETLTTLNILLLEFYDLVSSGGNKLDYLHANILVLFLIETMNDVTEIVSSIHLINN